jgi:dCMP deaminase
MTLQEKYSITYGSFQDLSKWDLRFLSLAVNEIATWSKDPSKQVGAVLAKDKFRFVVGYNGFPPGISDTDARLRDNETKQQLINHAELNAVLNAAKNNFQTDGSSLYVSYHPCHNCARVIVGAGVRKVVCPPPIDDPSSKWFRSHRVAQMILSEANVQLIYAKDDRTSTIGRDGENN